MQLSILLAALSASTLTTAIPMLNSTDPFAYEEAQENGIEKRGTYGWISNYAMTGRLFAFFACSPSLLSFPPNFPNPFPHSFPHPFPSLPLPHLRITSLTQSK